MLKKFIIVFFIIHMLFGGTLFGSEIHFLTHNAEGESYRDENNQLRGKKHSGRRAFHIELVREMMQLLGHTPHIEEFPFARGIKMVQQQDNYSLFNVIRTQERENTMKWVGPIQSTTNFFYELTESPTDIKILEDAKKVKQIGVLNGNVHHKFLQKKGFKNLYPTNSYVSCLKLLKHKRVDLIPLSDVALVKRLKEAGVSQDDIQRTPVILFKKEGYIAFSNRSLTAKLLKSL